jgi:hypothetical protein
MHFPMRALRSDSHRGLRDAVVGSLLLVEVDWKRARCEIRCAGGRNARDGGTSAAERARMRITAGYYATRKGALAVL